jgi:hypothetical protein
MKRQIFVVDFFFTEATASVASMDATPLHSEARIVCGGHVF